MPKVSKIEIRIKDKTHIYDVFFSPKQDKQFHIPKFPEDILKIVGKSAYEVVERFERVSDLEKSVREVLEEYYERMSVQRKVIIYSMDFSQEFRMNRTSIDSWAGRNPLIELPKQFDSFCSLREKTKGYGLSFDFCVATETKGAETKYLRQWKNDKGQIEMDSGGTRLQVGEAVIDWTPEREAFFENMKEAMTKMAVKFCDFFGQDEKKLLRIMDSGTKLLS
jgi:hypothetical protein